MLWTGDTCRLTGSYRTACDCADTLEFVTGTEFPSCISCAQRVLWVYLSPPVYFACSADPEEAEEISTHVSKLLQHLTRQEERNEPAVLFALGRLLLRLGRVASAIEVMYEVLDLIPWNISAYLELGKALIAFREPILAAEILHRGIAVAGSSKDTPLAYELIELAEIAEEHTYHFRPRSRERADRVPVDIAITRSDAIAPGIYKAVNLSETGLCVYSTREERIGGFVALDFSLDGVAIHVYAKVIWCHSDRPAPEHRPFTVGLQFMAPGRFVTETIAAYIHDQQAEAKTLACID